jgi:predicted RNase H-like nuclease (RuvC/YqgF family)
MKKFLMMAVLMIVSVLSKAQDTSLPQYLIEGGDTIGIIISIEQAQVLDNDSELLELFKKMKLDCDNLDTHYVSVINKLEEQIVLLKVQISDLTNQGKEKDKLINNLKSSLALCEENNRLCQKELENKNEEIKILKNEVFRQKVKKFVSVGGNVGLAILTIILVIKN